MAEHFSSFTRKKSPKYLLKTEKEQQEDNSTGPSAFWRIFAVLNNPLSIKLANKWAIEDELKIDGGKQVLVVFKLGIILN